MPTHRDIPRLAFAAAMCIAFVFAVAPAQAAQPELRDTGIAGEPAALVLALTGKSVAGEHDSSPPYAPDPKMQAEIAETIRFEETSRFLRAFRERMTLQTDRFVWQVLLLAAQEDDGMERLVIYSELHRRDISARAAVDAIARHFDDIDDDRLLFICDDALRALVAAEGRHILTSHIRRHSGVTSSRFIAFVYRDEPHDAVVAMMEPLLTFAFETLDERREHRRRILLAQRAISTSIWMRNHRLRERDEVEPALFDHLNYMVGHRAWWMRLYAAVVMEQNPEFRREDWVTGLRADEHPLVRDLAEQIPR